MYRLTAWAGAMFLGTGAMKVSRGRASVWRISKMTA
jgi:hypothetical protein